MVDIGDLKSFGRKSVSVRVRSWVPYARMCEWLKQLVCKTSLVKEFVGSNPTSSTIFEFYYRIVSPSGGNG